MGTPEKEARWIAALAVITFAVMVLILTSKFSSGASLYGTFTDPSGIYTAPTVKKVMKNGAAWTAANVAYFNTSTAAGPNVAGQVGFRLDNATSTATYELQNKNSAGTYRGYSWEYIDPDDYKADVSGLATTANVNSKFTNVSTHGDRDWTGSASVDEDALAAGLLDATFANNTTPGTVGEKIYRLPKAWPY